MELSPNPVIYEINTCLWLNELSKAQGAPVTLANIPTEALDTLAAQHIDTIWLLGVWLRSPLALEVARTHPGLQEEYRRALPDVARNDIVGSPYAVYNYEVMPTFGGREGLAQFREELARREMRLILDFVPNHVAIDHPLTRTCPICLIQGTEADLQARAGYYFRTVENRIFAHGRDPYFPAWTDTAQIDAFSPEARVTARETLLNIAAQCDGVRCDMAMLMVNRIFAATWHRDRQPATEYWEELIPAVRSAHPEFTFLAEVYWDMEAELINQGFDFAYDKRLYDRMRDHAADAIRDHLLAKPSYQRHMVRFVENHDEARAVTAFGVERSRAAATLAMLLPGAHLLHEGQMEGRRLKVPVQLGRRSPEPVNTALADFYRALLTEASQEIYHRGVWMALAVNAILGNDLSHESLIAFSWAFGSDWRIGVVNFAAQAARGRIMIPRPELNGPQPVSFRDALSDLTLQIPGEELLTAGLTVELNPYQVVVLRMS